MSVIVCIIVCAAFRAGGSGRLWNIDFTQLSWAPYDCKERFFRPEDASTCLSKKAILFSGDRSKIQLCSNAAVSKDHQTLTFDDDVSSDV